MSARTIGKCTLNFDINGEQTNDDVVELLKQLHIRSGVTLTVENITIQQVIKTEPKVNNTIRKFNH